MRRILALGVLALFGGRAAPASAAPEEASPDSLRLVLRADSLVDVDLAAARSMLPALSAGVEVWRDGWKDPQPSGLPRTTGDRLRFVAWNDGVYELRPPGHASARGPVPEPPDLMVPRLVEDGSGGIEERRTNAPPRLFGSLAGARTEVYEGHPEHWFVAKIEPQGTVSLPFDDPSPVAKAGSSAKVLVVLAGTHEGPLDVALRWGDRDLGSVHADTAAGSHDLDVEAPVETLRGAGPLTLVDRSAPPPERDGHDVSDDRGAVWVERAAVRFETKPHPGPRVEVRIGPGATVRRPLAVVDGTPLLRPHRDPPDPISAVRGADEIILAVGNLVPAAVRLAAHRTTRTGIRATVVRIADVWDRMRGGNADPDAIREYLAAVAAGGGRPRFVLLAGDATYDRTDVVEGLETIPTAYARTKYNGATASDRMLVAGPWNGEKPITGGPAVGRLPFREPREMDAYVDRVIAYETHPPADASRRMLRFVTSEGRFGPLIDNLTERLFRQIVARSVPPSYDVEVTFASATSAFLWPPPLFGKKVLDDLNAGSLLFTYVGHGWWDGFDALRYEGKMFPILRNRDVPQVDVQGTPPVFLVVACTTAQFDVPEQTSVGERLLARPNGPIAYWGATRVCHPVWNAMVGRQLALDLFRNPDARLGERVRDATDRAVLGAEGDTDRYMIRTATGMMAPGEDLDRLYREGAATYQVLGDPAIQVALPDEDLSVEASASEKGYAVRARGDGLPDGAEVHLSVEVPRDVDLDVPAAPAPDAPEAEKMARIRERHDKANDKALSRATAPAKAGTASAELPVDPAWRRKPLIVKAWTVAGGRVRQGSITTPAAK